MDLAAVIAALRESLKETVRAGQDDWLQFELEPVELELEAVVTKDVNGKIGWQVLEAGASRESVHTQRLKLRLTPMWRTAQGGLHRDFLIAGPVEDDRSSTFR